MTYERGEGLSIDWYTPPAVFQALDVSFDLDPCAPRRGRPWIPAREFYWLPERDGLVLPWHGRVWMNPPFGRFVARWVGRFLEHRNGIALVPARTSSRWCQRLIEEADATVFQSGRLKFVKPDGTDGPSAPFGVMFAACGADNVTALRASGLGVAVEFVP